MSITAVQSALKLSRDAEDATRIGDIGIDLCLRRPRIAELGQPGRSTRASTGRIDNEVGIQLGDSAAVHVADHHAADAAAVPFGQQGRGVMPL
jgi:hypothetical protein